MSHAYRNIMPRYRYRTEALIGPWRETRRQAESDAVVAGQAVFAAHPDGALVWRVLGDIEAKDELPVAE